ncbi:MAG TPA: hypothetical protein VLJ62_19265 [Burkholderiaceae bacterium]|nr:hypothetical protein [Burkholderiaceae bacterium]
MLVNLAQYLRDRNPEVARSTHVLKPVGPTQLEDDEKLFLNVSVAAILSDETLIASQKRSDAKFEALHQRLQDLGPALEDRQTQKSDVGKHVPGRQSS